MNESRERARYALAILFAINLLNFYDRGIFSAVAEPIRKEWLLSDSQVGWLATAFSLLYAAIGVPLGRLSDGWKRPLLLSWGVAFWSLLTAVSGIARGYWSLFAARLGVGVGEAACAPAANSLIGDLYPAARRARALAFFMMGLPLGNFLGSSVSGTLAARYGWRMAFYVACVPGLLLALLAMRLAEPARGAAESAPHAGRAHEGSPYWAVLRIPTIRWIIITGALFNFNMYAIQTFLPAYVSRYHLVDLRQANFITAIAFGAVGIPGMLLGGWAADRMAAARSAGRLLVCASALFLAGVFIYLALNLASGQLLSFGVLMSIGCLLGYFYYSGVYATIQDMVPPRLRGTAMALYFLAMYLMGGSFGPVLTGKLSDYFARRAMTEAGVSALNEHFRAVGLHSAMYVIPLCSVLVAAVLLVAGRTVSRDMNAVQAWMAAPDSASAALPGRLQDAEAP
ncbi:MAG TPA: MFS transporter [Candidatus Angelobacter sp.]|nr:MFS transporter [Candidatus Angelobacter sp.]